MRFPKLRSQALDGFSGAFLGKILSLKLPEMDELLQTLENRQNEENLKEIQTTIEVSC